MSDHLTYNGAEGVGLEGFVEVKDESSYWNVRDGIPLIVKFPGCEEIVVTISKEFVR